MRYLSLAFVCCLFLSIKSKGQVLSPNTTIMLCFSGKQMAGGALPTIGAQYEFLPARSKFNIGAGILGMVMNDYAEKIFYYGAELSGNISYHSQKRLDLRAGLTLRYIRGKFGAGYIDLGSFGRPVEKRNGIDIQLCPALIQLYAKRKKRKNYWSVAPSFGFFYVFGNMPQPPAPDNMKPLRVVDISFFPTAELAWQYSIPFKK